MLPPVVKMSAQIGSEQRTAWYSACGHYRYQLNVAWESMLPAVQFIGRNPSTATERQDDPTVRRCKRFAEGWGYGTLVMTNLAAFRDTDPARMHSAPDPIGPENDVEFLGSRGPAVVICAWGTHAKDPALYRHSLAVLAKLSQRAHVLRLTREGFPRHPLYLPAALRPVPYHAAQPPLSMAGSAEQPAR